MLTGVGLLFSIARQAREADGVMTRNKMIGREAANPFARRIQPQP
jgi:hypothetical protein